MDVFIGRQPIFNAHEQVVAYELLYRSNNSQALVPGDGATIDVLVNSFLNIGIDEVANGKPCFVNFTENLLLSSLADYLNPEQIVIEILEDVPITSQIISRVKELKALGYKIALDDFILNDQVDIYYELFAYIDYLKVDFLLSSLSQCIKTEQIVKSKFPHIRLLAEKVETREQFEIAIQSGYAMFQGYFFEKPQVIKTVDLPLDFLHYFEIMSLLNDEAPDINEISKLIERDVSLSYKLLQLISSFTPKNKLGIYSIKQAIVRVGLKDLRKWIYLLALRGNMNTHNKDAFIELLRSSLFRAKVCEKLAQQTTEVKYTECFFVGMFSLIDALLQRPMETLLDQLPLAEEVSETILGSSTKFTPYLETSIALGRMDWEKTEQLLKQLNIETINIENLYREAFDWVNQVTLSE